MTKDTQNLRTLTNQVQCVPELLVPFDAEIEVHIKFRQLLYTEDKIWVQTKFGIGLKLNNSSHTANQRILC